MKFYVCGDTHADIDWSKLNSNHFYEGEELTKEDYVLICGDFGGIWDGGKNDWYIQKWYNNKPWTTLFVDGNHENHDLLDAMPVKQWNGGKIHRVSDSIIHLMRGQTYDIYGRKIFTMGGADSIDKMYREENESWWSREMPSKEETDEAFLNIKKAGFKVDYVFTHTAPSNIVERINELYETDRLTDELKFYSEVLDFKTWYFGHFHQSVTYDVSGKKFQGLYNDNPIRIW